MANVLLQRSTMQAILLSSFEPYVSFRHCAYKQENYVSSIVRTTTPRYSVKIENEKTTIINFLAAYANTTT
jgi:hypothetical protein